MTHFIEDVFITNVSEAIVGHDGNVILAGVGKIKARGSTIAELRQKILLAMKKLPNSKNDFQVEISKFSSNGFNKYPWKNKWYYSNYR